MKAHQTALVDKVAVAHHNSAEVDRQEAVSAQEGCESVRKKHPSQGENRVESLGFEFEAVQEENRSLPHPVAQREAQQHLQEKRRRQMKHRLARFGEQPD